ncbi:MAG: mechanosensitive ion channel family protein [Clostridia bacterium]|nr:mechanosensitive ion channel family protein [Clostridia bacterium]
MTSKTKAQLNLAIKIIVCVLVIAAVVTIFVFADNLYGTDNLFEQWIIDHSITNSTAQWFIRAVPNLLKSFQIIAICFLGYKAIVYVLTRCFSKNNHIITIIKLLANFFKYLLAIVAILMVLSAWGVDTAALLVSAGILALVISLGAQSLIADIIAGMFIVFDGSYKVGDIIVIDGWRGTVTEIGIRTTKIIDAGGNIKIVNNSSIVTVINQTKELSLAKCTMCIGYGESLERVEVIISENLAKIKENIPAITDGPFYKGVTALSASSVDLLFVANCKEDDIYQVQRDMNRQFKLLFDKNGITIPFTQIVVNPPDEYQAEPTVHTEEKASAFVEEQKEASAGLEENNNG